MDIRALQRRLTALGYSPGLIDGKMGPKTRAAIQAFQRAHGLEPDGVFGPKTGRALALAEARDEPSGSFDHSAFFARVRADFGALTQPQVDGFNTVLIAMTGWPLSWMAYGLATAWHETAHTMLPILERGGPAYFKRMYDIKGARPEKAVELGNLSPGDGARYAGRGYVQLTGRINYRRFGLEHRPDDAVRPEVAARVLREGMASGAFTGKALKDYLPGDYVKARRIINGTDRAAAIARMAKKFEAALRAGGAR